MGRGKHGPHSMVHREIAQMNLPSDLKAYRAPVDAFQLIEESAAGVAFVVLLILAAMMGPM